MILEFPDFATVLLVGASGAGKSSFARTHFAETEVLSSDRFRALVCDDENNQAVSAEAFSLLHHTLACRLRHRRFCLIDATNLEEESRQPILDLARKNYCPVYVIVLDPPLKLLLERRTSRSDRCLPEQVIKDHHARLSRQLGQLKKQSKHLYHLQDPTELSEVEIRKIDPWSKSRADKGPFDLIGDIHGCYDELVDLIEKLGYKLEGEGETVTASHPQGRKLVFVGDLVDRGPKIAEVIRLVLNTAAAGGAYCAPGNHDMKLMRKFKGNKVEIRHGLEQSLSQMEHQPELILAYQKFFESVPSHYVLDGGNLIAVHAGLKEHFIERNSDRIWAFALYGEVTGQTDEQGYPIRGNWAAQYTGKAMIVYGHTPIHTPVWENNTLCIDTGCVFGHELTALQYPEKKLVSVPAKKRYYPGGTSTTIDVDSPKG